MNPGPYDSLPERAWWSKSVASIPFESISTVSNPKFKFSAMEARFGTAGSCFAQNVARELRAREYNFIDAEPPPPLLAPERFADFSFHQFSARYGNIYTPTQLEQLLTRATGRFEPVDEYWELDGRFYDPFRPSIEKGGFSSLDELLTSREFHLRRVMWLVRNIDVFVFTLGLTEAWRSKIDGAVFPVCPGARAGLPGTFDPSKYEFVNFGYKETMHAMLASMSIMKRINPNINFVLTVSPVPLIATATGSHVLVATQYSKSILRAVSGDCATSREDTIYFPSYEIISSAPAGTRFFENDLRNVTKSGVDFVMNIFFNELFAEETPMRQIAQDQSNGFSTVHCDEQVLEAYR